MSYLNYRCINCKKSFQKKYGLDHKCSQCGTKLIRVTLEDKRLIKAKRDFENNEIGE